MLRISPRNKIVTLEYIIKRLNSKSTESKSTPEKFFEQKYKYYQQSSFLPAILGFSSLTIFAVGLTYHYNEDFREKLQPFVSIKTKQFLDEYLGPHNTTRFKRMWDNFNPFENLSTTSKEKKKSEIKKSDDKLVSNEKTESITSSSSTDADIQKETKRVMKLNEELSKKLTAQMDAIKNESSNAVDSLIEYEKKIQEHNEKLKRAIEDEGTTIPNPWEDVNTSNQMQLKAKNNSDAGIKKLQAAIKVLETSIESGLKSEDLKSNILLLAGQEVIANTNYRIKQKLADIEKAQFNAQITNQYKELIYQGQERFKQELSSLNPNVSNWTKKQSDKLTVEDLNTMIVHAHRRMHQLQARISELEAMEVIRLESALTEQRTRDEKAADEKVLRELERERSKLFLEFQSESEVLKQHHESELRRALTRQASAHNEHINQLLKIQKEEVDKQHNLAIREALLQEREKMRASIDGWRMRVEGIEAAVEGRADEEIRSREAQDMWVACHALHGVLSSNGLTPPLARYINSFEEAAQPSSVPVLRLFLDSIPKCALEDGVCTQNLLTKRFEKIKKLCKRVAMIDETSASLAMYIVSWLRSLVILTPSHLIESDTEIDPENDVIETNQIIASAELAIWRQDFDLAVRLLNLLKGMPRVIVHDWIHDARIYLETKLAADSLSSYTSSKTAGSTPHLASQSMEQ